MKEIMMAYFQSWLDNDAEVLKDVFAEQAVYSESYGPEYHGLSQIITWFKNWNNKGKVLEWTIKRIIENDKSIVIEWYFKCCYEGVIDNFDGVTIADFDEDKKIIKLSEFQSKTEHYFPYDA